MNLKLSVYTNRIKGMSGYALYRSGDTIDFNVSPTISNNIKQDVLAKLTKGLRICQGFVSHEDTLYIEIQNQHLFQWLEGKVEYKGYSEYLDRAFEALECLDCRYKFMFVPTPIVSHLVNSSAKTQVKAQPLEEVFAGM